MRRYVVYILASRSGVLYTGVTGHFQRRLEQHIEGTVPGFTTRYRVNRLVYYETTNDIRTAIAREKQIKGWVRRKKVSLIEAVNPNWNDLASSAAEGEGYDSDDRPLPDPSSPLRGSSG